MATELARAIEGCLEMCPTDRPEAMEVSRLLDRFVETRLNRHPEGRAEG